MNGLYTQSSLNKDAGGIKATAVQAHPHKLYYKMSQWHLVKKKKKRQEGLLYLIWFDA